MTIRMRRLEARGLARMRVAAMAVVAVITVTTLGACVPGGAGGDSPEPRLYTGVIPDPAPLPAYAAGDSEMPVPPEPPTDYTDEQALAEYEAQMMKYLEEVQKYQDAMSESGGDTAEFANRIYELVEDTRASDEKSVAAWQSLLVASGIAVGYGDGAVEVSGMRGAGIPMTTAELRLHALLGALDARIPLTQLASVIGAYGELDEGALVQELYDDLSNQMSTGFGFVFMALDPEVFPEHHRWQTDEQRLEEMTLTGAQAALVLRRLSVDLLNHAEDLGGIDAVSWHSDSAGGTEVLAAASHLAQNADGPCGLEEEPWEVENRRDVGKGLGWGFGHVMDKLSETFEQLNPVKTALGAAQAGMALATMLAKMLALNADFSLGQSPLVRTKDRTAGERGEVVVTMSYPSNALADVTGCLAILLAPIGFDVNDFAGGPAEGVDAELVLKKSKRLWFSTERGGTASYRQKTAANGIATFPVLGAPQQERLPSGAEPEEVTVPVRLDSNLEGSDLVKDLKAAAWDRISPSLAGIMASILSRMKLVIFSWEVPVRDWKLVGNFDVTLTGELWSHSGRYETSSGDCGTFTHNESTTTQGSVDTQERPHVTAHYVTEVVDGNPVSGLVIYPRGSSIDDLKITREGVELLHFPVSYSASRSMSEPGADPMPPHYVDPYFYSCGDGIGGWTPPQPDCGPRDYLGLATLLLQDGEVRVLGNDDDKEWEHCGSGLPYANPLTPPTQMSKCHGAAPVGGQVPSADAVFGERGWFEITGSLSCSRDGEGSLDRFTFDWTLKFCRIDQEGERSKNC